MRPAAAVLLAGLLLGQSTLQYVRTRSADGAHCQRWPVSAGTRGRVTYVQSTAGDATLGAGAFDAVSRSAQTWQTQLQACGNLDLAEGARSASRSVGYLSGGPNENLVLFRTQLCSAVVPSADPCHAAGTCGNVYDCWDNPSSYIALTTTTFIDSGAREAELLDADVEVNAALFSFTLVDSPPCSGGITTNCVRYDVQNAMTHEFGHFLGLAHAPDLGSTMYASEPLGETSKRVLDSGSKQFVCDVYPQGRASLDCTASSGGSGGSAGCSSTGSPGALIPGLALLLAAFAGRRVRAARARERSEAK